MRPVKREVPSKGSRTRDPQLGRAGWKSAKSGVSASEIVESRLNGVRMCSLYRSREPLLQVRLVVCTNYKYAMWSSLVHTNVY